MKLDQLQPGEVTFTIERSGNQHSSCQRRKVPQLVPGLLKGKESQGKESQVLETNSLILVTLEIEKKQLWNSTSYMELRQVNSQAACPFSS